MSGSLERVYPYNFKTIAYTSAIVTETGTPDPKGGGSTGLVSIKWACNKRLYLRIEPPEDFLEWKNLHMELAMSFRQYEGAWPYTIPTAAKVLESVRVVQELPFPVTELVPGKGITLNRAASGLSGNELDVSIDLTQYLDPTGINWVELTFPDYFIDMMSWGFISSWKLDALFTTEGIR
jgi:hypothetical protein